MIKKRIPDTQNTFLSLNTLLYWTFATIWCLGFLAIIMMYGRQSFDKLVPEFISSLLIKHDWLTIIYFPIIAILIISPLFIISSRYRWFCSRIHYRIEGDQIVIIYRQTDLRFFIKDIIYVNCDIHKTIFPLLGRGQPSYYYYTLVIRLSDRKYRFDSAPFQNEDAKDFICFVESLSKLGLSIKIPTPEPRFNWLAKLILKLNKKINK